MTIKIKRNYHVVLLCLIGFVSMSLISCGSHKEASVSTDATQLYAVSVTASPDDYVPGQLIIKHIPPTGLQAQQTSSLDMLNAQHGATSKKALLSGNSSTSGLSVQSIDNSIVYVINFDDSADIAELATTYQAESFIEYAEPNYYIESFNTPNDPGYSNQDYLKSTNANLYQIWDIPRNDTNIIAVLDSGIDYTHPDLENINWWVNENETLNGEDDDGNGLIDDGLIGGGYDFSSYADENNGDNDPMDNYSHGTHMVGTIAANTDNGVGIAGLNGEAIILNAQFLNSSGVGTHVGAAASIIYAVNMGARVINCSWGYYKSSNTLKNAINYALDNDVIVVAAVGNTGTSIREYPSYYGGVIGVSAISLTDTRPGFTSFGNHVNFTAYGVEIYSTKPDNDYGYANGTSSSTAIMTGIISRILDFDSSFTSEEVFDLLLESVDFIGSDSDGKDYIFGYGRIDIEKLKINLQIDVPNNIDLSDENYDVDTIIFARKTIDATDVVIDNNARVTFKAGEKIDIHANFDVKSGASFDAVVE